MSPSLPTNDSASPTRRRFLDQGLRLGSAAFASLLLGETTARAGSQRLAINPLAAKPPQFASRAKHVIQLFMTGGPSHLDMFDYKPTLTKMAGQPLPESIAKSLSFAQIRDGKPLLLPSPWGYK